LCSSVTDLAPRHGEIDCTQLDHAGFSVRSHTLTFYGICPNCRSAGRQCRSRPHA
jgi:Fe2+ or Zn2+ uptake regulation protein